MKNKYKLICVAITLVAIISLACVPAMAYQLGVIVADSESDGQYVEPTDSYQPIESEVVSSDSVSSEPVSDIFSDTESDIYSEDTSSEYQSEPSEPVESILESEPSNVSSAPSSNAESHYTSSSENSYHYTPSYSDGTNYEVPYTSLFTTSEDDTRSVMTSKNWSDIALEDSDGKAVADINIKDGTGDFNFIKENKNKSNSSVYYWLAGGIACIIVGLSGIAIVIVLAKENKKKMIAAASGRTHTSRQSIEKGASKRPTNRNQKSSKYDTAEFDLPDRYDDGF